MNYTREFLLQFDGEIYVYETGHWWRIEIKEVAASAERPAGLKYSLAFFDEDDNCLVRFDNSHAVKLRGRPNPAAFDHWHRFSNGQLIPYAFVDEETLVRDFSRLSTSICHRICALDERGASKGP